jgi:hypothetical protein
MRSSAPPPCIFALRYAVCYFVLASPRNTRTLTAHGHNTGEGDEAHKSFSGDERRGANSSCILAGVYSLDSAAATKEYRGFLYAGDTPGASLHTDHIARSPGTAQRRHEVRTTRPPLRRIDATHTTPPNCLTNSNVIPQLFCTHVHVPDSTDLHVTHTYSLNSRT